MEILKEYTNFLESNFKQNQKWQAIIMKENFRQTQSNRTWLLEVICQFSVSK